MTTIKELQEIHKEEMNNFKATNFTYNKALEELKLAHTATSLAEQFKSLLKVVNRYHNTTDNQIKQGLLNALVCFNSLGETIFQTEDCYYPDKAAIVECLQDYDIL